MTSMDELVEIAGRHGATVGVTDLAPFPGLATRMETAIADGTRARLGFTYKDVERVADPARSFPWARSIVVVAVPYLRDGDGRREDRSVARFADGDRYRSLVAALEDVVGVLETAGHRCEMVYDDERIADRAVARRAGVGWMGKSTMVLVPGHGPWVLLGSVVTDAVLPVGEPMQRTCGTCDACIPACPTGAIVAPGVIDARRCLAAVLQARGDVPRHLRVAVGGRIYGCDDCLTSCPPGSRALDAHDAGADRLTPQIVLGMSDTELTEVVAHWYVPGRRMRFLRRNALVALGNVGGDDAVPILLGYLGNPDAMLRRHAAWSLGRLAPEVLDDLRDRLEDHETDVGVLEELNRIAT